MLKFVYAIWNFVETPRVYLHDEGYYFFRFANELDKMDILQNGPYTFDYRPLVLKQWTAEFQMGKESIRQMPLWVTFPNLPVEYWSIENLGRIASYIGNLVCTDSLIAKEERISYARMLIELDVTQLLPEQMVIEEAHGKCITQQLNYDWWLKYCQDCDKPIEAAAPQVAGPQPVAADMEDQGLTQDKEIQKTTGMDRGKNKQHKGIMVSVSEQPANTSKSTMQAVNEIGFMEIITDTKGPDHPLSQPP
ncbi:uncharacterized protein LOC132630340 [Lycium barbarum]|uniref:uncharacterized protein LOC132630340 n=1 Tax=Lycium barbarum TaxID=112863 RepID=UPI00293E169D|nr:uncharacterized protein LOC132630340 [Lycium barbarum]